METAVDFQIGKWPFVLLEAWTFAAPIAQSVACGVVLGVSFGPSWRVVRLVVWPSDSGIRDESRRMSMMTLLPHPRYLHQDDQTMPVLISCGQSGLPLLGRAFSALEVYSKEVVALPLQCQRNMPAYCFLFLPFRSGECFLYSEEPPPLCLT